MDFVDGKLVKLILKGDTDAFVELVDKYKDKIFRYCFKMLKDHQEAEDLTQETFIRVYNNLDRYSNEYKFSTWIYKIATNLCIDRLRKQRLNTVSIDQPISEDEDLTISLPDWTNNPENLHITKDLEDRVSETIMELPDKYRAAIVLRHLQQLSYEEISAVLELPVNTVKTRIYRGREVLRGRLKMLFT
jgi:RNA polymerase sigma-70 factor (ECF subfamily)